MFGWPAAHAAVSISVFILTVSASGLESSAPPGCSSSLIQRSVLQTQTMEHVEANVNADVKLHAFRTHVALDGSDSSAVLPKAALAMMTPGSGSMVSAATVSQGDNTTAEVNHPEHTSQHISRSAAKEAVAWMREQLKPMFGLRPGALLAESSNTTRSNIEHGVQASSAELSKTFWQVLACCLLLIVCVLLFNELNARKNMGSAFGGGGIQQAADNRGQAYDPMRQQFTEQGRGRGARQMADNGGQAGSPYGYNGEWAPGRYQRAEPNWCC